MGSHKSVDLVLCLNKQFAVKVHTMQLEVIITICSAKYTSSGKWSAQDIYSVYSMNCICATAIMFLSVYLSLIKLSGHGFYKAIPLCMLLIVIKYAVS